MSTLIAPVKLLPSPEQAAALETTVRRANAAAQVIGDLAWGQRNFGRYALQKAAYHKVRESSGLTAQVVLRLLAKVCDGYKVDKESRHTFDPLGAIAYDARILRWFLDASQVSIWTVAGRQRIPFVCGVHQRELLGFDRGESDLVYRDGEWYLFAGCRVPDPELIPATDVLGVDLGIVNIASDSDGNVYAGAHLNALRRRHQRLRDRLQAKKTKSAKRLLRMRRRKEARLAADVNHCISKKLVAAAERTGRGIALEDLTGILDRVRARRPQRATLHSWAFAQLGAFISYKARLNGVPVVFVDPHNTSRTCPGCGHVARANRRCQSKFQCVSCGLAGPADTVAALNIRVKGRGEVMCPYAGSEPGRASDHRRLPESLLPGRELASPRL